MNPLLKQIMDLPNELQDIIQSYLPICVVVFLNKTNYYLYHKVYIKNIICDSYMRSIIRNNLFFILDNLLEEYYKPWTKKYKYKYKTILYADYLHFLIYYSIENNANECKKILLLFSENHGISKNQHKKNTSINIRWKH